MSEDRGWTSFFFKRGIAGDEFLSKFLEGVARIFEGGDEEETGRKVRAELKRILDCEDVSLYFQDNKIKPGAHEGAWVLTAKSGFGEGNMVSQADAMALPELEPGKPVPFSDDLAQKAAMKAIALAFEEDAFYGCDIENKIVLLKDPKPEDDLGSGDLSVLAIPLRFEKRAGRVTERTRVGVLVLFKTPVRRELAEVEGGLRSLLACALVAPSCQLRDPVTGMYTEPHLRTELERQVSMYELTQGKLRGGFVVGMVDTLKVYKQALESSARIDPGRVSEKVSEVLSLVGAAVMRRATDHTLNAGVVYRGGLAGRVGNEGFGVVLPLLQPGELCMWAVNLSKDVIKTHFEGEEHLGSGDVTVSLRVIPFARGKVDELWGLAQRALEDIERNQLRARRDDEELRKVVNQIRVFHAGKWITTRDYVKREV
jgi:GGDEF domain-containing protein